MSFGFSPSDVAALVQLAFKMAQNSRKACGEYAELTREASSLHVVLQRLQQEFARSESPINTPGDSCIEELASIVNGCRKPLNVLDKILEKYNALSDQERSGRKLWPKVRFGNGQMADVGDIRSKITYYTSALSIILNMASMGSIGRVERQMNEAGGDLREIRNAVNDITAHLMGGANREESVLTAYADDDAAIWKEFRRELVKDGFSSSVIKEHKNTIMAYVKELGSRGLLDDISGDVGEIFAGADDSSDNVLPIAESMPGATSRDNFVLGRRAPSKSGQDLYDEIPLGHGLPLLPSRRKNEREIPNSTRKHITPLKTYHQSLGRPVRRSKIAPGAEKMTTNFMDGSHLSSKQTSIPNTLALTLDDQADPADRTRELQDVMGFGNTQISKETNLPQQRYRIEQIIDRKGTLELTVEILDGRPMKPLFAPFGSPTRFPDWPGISHTFIASSSTIYYVINGMNVSLHLKHFKYRATLLLTCIGVCSLLADRFAVCESGGGAKTTVDEGQVSIHTDLVSLKEAADKCLELMKRIRVFLNRDARYDIYDGLSATKILQHTPLLCAMFLEEAVNQKWRFGELTRLLNDNDVLCDLLLRISAMNTCSDTVLENTIDRVWHRFSESFKDTSKLELSTKEARKELKPISAFQKLHDVRMDSTPWL